MKTFFKTTIILSLLLLTGSAFATCTTGGNQCNEYTTPSITWGPVAAVKLNGDGFTYGQGLSGADGVGGVKASQAYTMTEGTMTVKTMTNLTGDNIAGCTSCGDNQIQLTLDGMQKTVAGAMNQTATENGPAQSMAESAGLSNLHGQAWGQLGGTLSIK